MNKFNTLLLASASALALALAAAPVLAQTVGGTGGVSTTAGSQGGVGGTSDGATAGGTGVLFGGGGGGGAGATGGAGGDGDGAAGGAGGPGGAANGGNGTAGSGNGAGGAGGGGGGGHGAVVTTTAVNNGTIRGGNGGGGGFEGAPGGGGGGGGAGGYGVEITTAGVTYTNNSAGLIAGGFGGNGGSASTGVGGDAGQGGYGVFVAGGSTLINSGEIDGGTGGSVTAGGGAVGAGGAGVVGGGITIIDSGTIVGGKAGSFLGARENAITFTGGSNTLTLENGFSLTGNIGDTGSITFNQSSAQSLSAIITGTGSATDSGAGLLTFSGASTYSGGTTIATGAELRQGVDSVLNLGGIVSSAFGVGTLTFDGGTLQAGGAGFGLQNEIAVNTAGGTIDPAGNTIFVVGVIADGNGPGGLTINGTSGGGTVLFNQANTYSGGTTLTAGVLEIGTGTVGTPGAITSSAIGTGVLNFNGGTLAPTDIGFTIANLGNVQAGGGTIDANSFGLTYSGAIGGAASSGTLTIQSSGGPGTVTFTAANSYTAGTAILSQATLALSGSGSVAASSGVNLQGGTLDISGTTAGASINLLYGTGTVALGSKTLTVMGGSLASTAGFDGVIEDSGIAGGTGGSFTLAGGGEYFTAINTYTGTTTIASGATLILSGTNGSFGTGPVINNGSLVYFNSSSSTLSTAISGAGSLTVETKTLTVTAAQTYTGATIVFGGFSGGPGILALSGSGAIAQSSSVSVGQNAVFDISQTYVVGVGGAASIKSLSGGGTVKLGISTLNITAGADTFSGVIQDGGILPVTDGNLTISGGTETLSGANIYTGFTTIDAGATLALSGSGSMIYSGSVWGGGTFDISQTTSGASIHSLGSSGIVALGSKTLTIAYPFGETFSGSIQDGGIGGGTGGGLVLGSGTETFSGVNTFTGAATVNSGATLVLSGSGSIAGASGLDDEGTFAIGATTSGASIKSLSGAGSVTTGSQPLTITAAAGAFSGQITGVGPVTITGGTEIFTGDEIYQSTTTIGSGAALQLGNGGTTGALASISIVDNGSLIINHSNLFVAPSISGSGGLTQAGSGRFLVANTESYTGPTTISAGTVDLVGIGSLAGGVVDNAAFDISAVNGSTSIQFLTGSGAVNLGAVSLTLLGPGTFSGAIGGTGGVKLSASGTQIFTGNNTYTGATTISAGDILQLGSGGTSGSVAGNIANAGALAFNRSDTLAYAGVISGAGTVTQAGSGTVILTGNNTETGSVTIAHGALQIGNGGTTGSVGGNIADAGALTFNHSDALTYAGVISGAGTMTQAGSGNLILTGANTFTGVVNVGAGTLSVNGMLPGAVSVASGGKLGGNGTVGGVTLASGGTLAPGNSIGTLHVGGNLALNSGSTYSVEVSPSAADETIVSGTASLAGTLALSPSAGTYAAGTDYVLISAGSITGTFGNVTGASFPGVASSLVYSPTHLDLILSNPIFAFAAFGTTANQVAAGTAVAAGAPGGALYVALGNVIGSGNAAISGALAQFSGEIHASLRSAAVEDSRVIRDAVLNHVHQAGEGVSLWLKGWSDAGAIQGGTNANNLNHNSSGVILGVDTPLGDGLRVGVAGSYSGSTASVHGLGATATGNSGHLIGYADWGAHAYELSLGADYSWGSNQVTRPITALSETDSDHQTNRTSQWFADGGYKIATAGAVLEPHATIAWITTATGAFAETGGVSALSGSRKSNATTYGILGLRAALDDWNMDGAALTPRLDLGWQHAFDALTPSQALTIVSTGQGFSVTGVPLGTDSASVQLGLCLALSPAVELSLDYDGDFSSHVEEHAVAAGLKLAF